MDLVHVILAIMLLSFLLIELFLTVEAFKKRFEAYYVIRNLKDDTLLESAILELKVATHTMWLCLFLTTALLVSFLIFLA